MSKAFKLIIINRHTRFKKKKKKKKLVTQMITAENNTSNPPPQIPTPLTQFWMTTKLSLLVWLKRCSRAERCRSSAADRGEESSPPEANVRASEWPAAPLPPLPCFLSWMMVRIFRNSHCPEICIRIANRSCCYHDRSLFLLRHRWN